MSEEEITNIKIEFSNFKSEIMAKIHETKDDEELMKLLSILQKAKIRYQELLGERAYNVDELNEQEIQCDITDEELQKKKMELSNMQYELNEQIKLAKDDMEYMTLRGKLQQVKVEYNDLLKKEQIIANNTRTSGNQSEDTIHKK